MHQPSQRGWCSELEKCLGAAVRVRCQYDLRHGNRGGSWSADEPLHWAVSLTKGIVVGHYTSLEEIESCCGRQVRVREGGKLVAGGHLGQVNLASVPAPPQDGEGWRLEQVLVLVVDGEPCRVRFGATVTVQS